MWNFYSQYIDSVNFSSMPEWSHLPVSLSGFSVERRACNLAYSLILSFSAVSLAISSRWVDLTVE